MRSRPGGRPKRVPNGKITASSPAIPSVLGAEVDGRCREVRMYRHLLDSFISDRGGADMASMAEVELARRAAGAGVLAAKLEAQIVEGRQIDVTEYVSLLASQSRVLAKLGIGRAIRPLQLLGDD
jgi:hypothetical protein